MSTIQMTNIDPGEGQALAADTYLAVYGGASLLDMFYPVGCFFETTDTSFDPNVTWGGIWQEDTAGKVLVAQDSNTFDTVGDTGGSETHRHQITLQQRVWFGAAGFEGAGTSLRFVDDNSGTGTYRTASNMFPSATISRNSGLSNNLTSLTHDGFGQEAIGNSHSSSSLQPYLVVKRWHRIS